MIIRIINYDVNNFEPRKRMSAINILTFAESTNVAEQCYCISLQAQVSVLVVCMFSNVACQAEERIRVAKMD